MWEIKNPEIRPATLDFTSSEQGKREVVQLFSDDINLINALELVDWDTEDSQLLVCEECGFTHCKVGDWVSIRRSDSLVLILPSSNYVWGVENDRREYSPPYYLRAQGIPYLHSSTYEHLRSLHSSFPAIDQIQPLKLKEAALLFQWNAPERILGEPPKVIVRDDMIAGSSEHWKTLQKMLETQYNSDSLATLRPISSNERVVSLYLDTTKFTEWHALVFDGSEYRLLVDSKYVVDEMRLL
jgi:hypothetical protein